MKLDRARIGRFAIVVALMATDSGCASILRSSRQDVVVESVPPGATLYVDGLRQGKTPMVVDLRRGDAHVLELEMSGYEKKTQVVNAWVQGGWVALDFLCGVLPIAVDAATGNWKGFEGHQYIALRNLSAPEQDSLFRTAPSAGLSGEVVLAQGRSTYICGMRASLVEGLAQRAGWGVPGRGGPGIQFQGDGDVATDPRGPFRKDPVPVEEGAEYYLRLQSGDVFRLTIMEVTGRQVRVSWQRM